MLTSLISLQKSTKKEALIVPSCQLKGKGGRKNGIRCLKRKGVSIALAQVHAIPNLTWDWRNSRIGPLEWGRMQLCTTPALKGAPFIAVNFMLPSDPPHCLLLQWWQREQLPTHSAEWVMVVVEDPLVTVFVTDVSGSCQFATVHVSENMLILASLVTLVTRVWPFCVKNGGQENHIAGLSDHRFAKYLHCTASKTSAQTLFSTLW